MSEDTRGGGGAGVRVENLAKMANILDSDYPAFVARETADIRAENSEAIRNITQSVVSPDEPHVAAAPEAVRWCFLLLDAMKAARAEPTVFHRAYVSLILVAYYERQCAINTVWPSGGAES